MQSGESMLTWGTMNSQFLLLFCLGKSEGEQGGLWWVGGLVVEANGIGKDTEVASESKRISEYISLCERVRNISDTLLCGKFFPCVLQISRF